jgi:hypothetical protein
MAASLQIAGSKQQDNFRLRHKDCHSFPTVIGLKVLTRSFSLILQVWRTIKNSALGLSIIIAGASFTCKETHNSYRLCGEEN